MIKIDPSKIFAVNDRFATAYWLFHNREQPSDFLEAAKIFVAIVEDAKGDPDYNGNDYANDASVLVAFQALIERMDSPLAISSFQQCLLTCNVIGEAEESDQKHA